MNDPRTKFDGELHVEADASETLTFEAGDNNATVYVSAPESRPLSTAEPHAQIKVVSDDATVTMTLDGEGIDALADGVYHAQVRPGDDT